MTMKKLINKPFCMAMLLCGLVYGLALPFFWGNDPMSPLGTLSLLCEDRKLWFWLWGILMSGGIELNAQYMYKKFGCKSKLLDILCILSFVGMCCIALTLGHSIADWNPKRILHWVATGAFIVLTFASIALFFIMNRKTKGFGILIVCICVILLTFVFIFAFVGKSALMEMVPFAMLQILLFIINFTKAVPVTEDRAAIGVIYNK